MGGPPEDRRMTNRPGKVGDSPDKQPVQMARISATGRRIQASNLISKDP